MLSRAVIGSLQNAPGRTAPANLRIASSTTWSRAVSSSSCTPSVHSIYNTIWRTKPAVFPIAVSTWSRSMARNNRPNSNNNKPIEYSRPLGTPTPSKPERVAFTSAIPPQRARSSNESDKPGFSKSQVEVDSNSAPARNTVPLSKGTGFGALHNAQKNGEESEFSGKQEEFETAPLSENTAAQSASPSAIDPAEASAPSQPLPDLTRGIPSTLQFETTGSSKLSPLDVTEAEESGQPLGGGRGKGELPASAYVSSSDKKRARFANIMYGMVLLLVTTGGVYLGRNWEEEEEERAHPDAPSGWALGLMWNRAKARLGDQANYYSEPAFPKLLPDPDPIFERPYTLVLSMEDLLIHSEWSREHGWRMAKRPGVDYFLRYLSQYYELVIFTSQPWAVAEPVIRKLDPFHIVTWPLFREATKYENGAYVKDLSYLNRDLSKVILIDTVQAHAKKQPENAIILPKWTGDVKDKELVSFIPFLEYIHTMAYSDVRKAIASFEGTHLPTEFARREAIARQKFQEQLAEELKKRPKVSGLGAFGNALGIKGNAMMVPTDGEQTPAEAFAQGKMLQDQARERGMRNYEALEKEIRENGEKWLKEEAAHEEKAKEEGMKAMKSGFTGWFGGSPGSGV